MSGFFSLFKGVGTQMDMASRFLTSLKSDVELNNLFLNTLLPKLLIKENAIIKEAVQKMIKKVFRLSFKMCQGKFIPYLRLSTS